MYNVLQILKFVIEINQKHVTFLFCLVHFCRINSMLHTPFGKCPMGRHFPKKTEPFI